MYQISVGSLQVDVVRKEIKNLHLAVYPPEGRVRIATPINTDDDAVRLFVISKMGWIKKHIEQFQKQERQTERHYISGESHYFRGQRYLLKVIEHAHPPKVVIRNKKYIDLYVRPNSTIEQRGKVLTEWYRAELKIAIPPMIEKWEQIMNVKVNDWRVKLMKVKWGTCNIAQKRIWLNLELAKKPQRSLEYIIVHEMTHLLERHHNARFKAYMDKFLPNWRSLREELNEMIL